MAASITAVPRFAHRLAVPNHFLPSFPSLLPLHVQLDVPVLVMLATGSGCFRKPETGMWELMCAQLNGRVPPGEKCGECGVVPGCVGVGACGS